MKHDGSKDSASRAGAIGVSLADSRKWAPPVVFAALGFSLGLFGNVINLSEKVLGWFTPPPLPSVSEEYLMVELEHSSDVRADLKGVAEQVKGAKVIFPKWLETSEASIAQSRTIFCMTWVDQNLEECEAGAKVKVLIGTYALKSFDPKPVSGLKVDLAVLSNSEGAVDALDGFIDGELSEQEKCLVLGSTGNCGANWTDTQTLDRLPTLGPGEMIIIPLFFSIQFEFSPDAAASKGDAEFSYDGLAPTPFNFPVKVWVGDRVLIERSRPMQETPRLTQGVYEGRG